MSKVAPLLATTDHYRVELHRQMARMRFDHRAMRFKTTVFLVAFLPLFALLLGAFACAGDWVHLTLTAVVVLTAKAL